MYRVMLVDDEVYMLNGLKNVIKWEEHGLEIAATATNGSEALDILDRCKIHIVLTDIRMPEMDGLELIRNLKKKNLKTKCIILSGYDDFNYVKEALKLGIENYLLKPVNEEELSQTLLNTIDIIENETRKNIHARKDSLILKNNILTRWVTGDISPSELIERSQLLGMDLYCENFMVCILRIINIDKLKTFDDIDLLRFSLTNVCQETMGSSINSEIFFNPNGDVVFLLSGSSRSMDRENILKLLNLCIQRINHYLKVDVFISTGSMATDFQAVHLSCKCAMTMMDYILILEPNSIADYEEKAASRSILAGDFNIRADHLKSLFLSGNSEQLSEFIDALYNRAFSTSAILPKNIQNISIEILYTIIKAAREKKPQLNVLSGFKWDPYTLIASIDSKAQLVSLVKKSVLDILNTVREHHGSYSPLIKRTIDYIESNYASDISLKMLSVAFKVNSTYLGQLFKKETGEMFSSFLTNIRIEKARQLLVESNLNANEIALKVGYTNPNYFYYSFKKQTGKFPTDYRRDLS